MDRGAWQATVHGVARVGHNLVTKERESNRTFLMEKKNTTVSEIIYSKIHTY